MPNLTVIRTAIHSRPCNYDHDDDNVDDDGDGDDLGRREKSDQGECRTDVGCVWTHHNSCSKPI